jgi:aryl-alcohol dehydrogenase-like predicted oxidoreductase
MATTRRHFIQSVGTASAATVAALACEKRGEPPPSTTGSAVPSAVPAAPKPPENKAPVLGDIKLSMKGPMPRRALGSTGVEVSLLALGGYHLGTVASQAEASRIVHEALDNGLDFFDSAWEYHDGKSEAWLGNALEGRRDKAFVMTKVCTHGRDASVAMKMLEDSLRRLKTDTIDLWQIHEVIYDDDPERHYAAGGVLEALRKAKESGKVRFVGFTGHKDPAIHLAMLRRGFPFDTCQLPLNCFDGAGFRSFEREVLPELATRRIAALGMKSLSGEGEPVKKGVVSAKDALSYAMSLPVSAVVSGIDSVAVLRQNLDIAGGFQPLPDVEMQALRDRVRHQAMDGRFELFKSSKKYDGDPGREQHGFPKRDELGS